MRNQFWRQISGKLRDINKASDTDCDHYFSGSQRASIGQIKVKNLSIGSYIPNISQVDIRNSMALKPVSIVEEETQRNRFQLCRTSLFDILLKGIGSGRV